MKWIKFTDLMPIEGVNIFIFNGKGIDVVKWEDVKHDSYDDYEEWIFKSDLGQSISDVDCYKNWLWAPISFVFEEKMLNENGSVRDKYVLDVKNHKNYKDIIEMQNKLSNKPKDDFNSNQYVSVNEKYCAPFRSSELIKVTNLLYEIADEE